MTSNRAAIAVSPYTARHPITAHGANSNRTAFSYMIVHTLEKVVVHERRDASCSMSSAITINKTDRSYREDGQYSKLARMYYECSNPKVEARSSRCTLSQRPLTMNKGRRRMSTQVERIWISHGPATVVMRFRIELNPKVQHTILYQSATFA
jgi:hypothetical protein